MPWLQIWIYWNVITEGMMMVSALPPLTYFHNIPVSPSRNPSCWCPHRDRPQRTSSYTKPPLENLQSLGSGFWWWLWCHFHSAQPCQCLLSWGINSGGQILGAHSWEKQEQLELAKPAFRSTPKPLQWKLILISSWHVLDSKEFVRLLQHTLCLRLRGK